MFSPEPPSVAVAGLATFAVINSMAPARRAGGAHLIILAEPAPAAVPEPPPASSSPAAAALDVVDQGGARGRLDAAPPAAVSDHRRTVAGADSNSDRVESCPPP
ncbi:hypothetical protein GCM10028864_59860 [Microlunatus parietis]